MCMRDFFPPKLRSNKFAVKRNRTFYSNDQTWVRFFQPFTLREEKKSCFFRNEFHTYNFKLHGEKLFMLQGLLGETREETFSTTVYNNFPARAAVFFAGKQYWERESLNKEEGSTSDQAEAPPPPLSPSRSPSVCKQSVKGSDEPDCGVCGFDISDDKKCMYLKKAAAEFSVKTLWWIYQVREISRMNYKLDPIGTPRECVECRKKWVSVNSTLTTLRFSSTSNVCGDRCQ